MKHIKSWIKSPVHLMLLLTAAAVLGMGTLAYFTDVEAAVNTLRFGQVDIETNEEVDGLTKKGIGVTANGVSDCYVRIRADIPTVTYSYEDGQGQIQTGQAVVTLPGGGGSIPVSQWENQTKIELENGAYWEKNSEDGCWYYSGILSMGGTALFLEAVTYPGLWDEAEGQLADPFPDGLTWDMLSIPITSEAVQAANIDVGDKTGAQAAMAAFAQAAQAQ